MAVFDEVTLAEGDTLTLAADRPRNFRNPGAEACHLLVVSGAVGGG